MNWILLRGLGRHSLFWGEFPEKLKTSLAPESSILCLDLPGLNGEKTNFKSISDITDEMRSAWLKQKKDGPWSIAAISLGGMIALNWASRYPGDFKHLVTINSSDAKLSPVYERLTPTAVKYLFKILKEPSLRIKEKYVLEATSNLIEINDDILDKYEEIALKSKINLRILIKQLWAAFHFKSPNKIEIPYTVLTSKGDKFVSFKCSKKLAKRYNANIFVHDVAGHDIPLDDPSWVIYHLKDLN